MNPSTVHGDAVEGLRGHLRALPGYAADENDQVDRIARYQPTQ